jgi:hypothetical protein
MGLAEDLKALQELRDKGELSESAYAAGRDAAIGKQAPPVKATPIISKPTRIFLAVVILLVGFSILIVIYVNATTGHGSRSEKRAAMSPQQADDLLSHLNRTTVATYCGDGKPLPPTAKNPRNASLEYPFGYFLFESGGSVLMGTTIQISGMANQTVWTNVHRDSTDENKEVRVNRSNMVKTAEMLAMLNGISVYEYEGKNALQIVQGTPCLAGLATRY